MDVRGWRKIARGTDAWKLILKEARVTHGPPVETKKGFNGL
jgi:hypothetical protein